MPPRAGARPHGPGPRPRALNAGALAPRRAGSLVAGAALLWSTGGLAIKLVPLDALGVVFWRATLTVVFLVAVFRPSLERWRKASFATAVVYALMILTFVTATKWTTAANAIFLQYTGPFYVLAFGPCLLRRGSGRPTRSRSPSPSAGCRSSSSGSSRAATSPGT